MPEKNLLDRLQALIDESMANKTDALIESAKALSAGDVPMYYQFRAQTELYNDFAVQLRIIISDHYRGGGE